MKKRVYLAAINCQTSMEVLKAIIEQKNEMRYIYYDSSIEQLQLSLLVTEEECYSLLELANANGCTLYRGEP